MKKNCCSRLQSLLPALCFFTLAPFLHAQDATNSATGTSTSPGTSASTDTSTASSDATENHVQDDASKFKLKQKSNASLPTLYLVGDSTMKNGTPGQEGWGDEMAQFFDTSKINVVNEAIGGRSSRTYQNEGRWDALVPMIQKGDFVVIEFGHNDAGAVNDNFRARASLKGNGDETQEIDNMLTKKHEVVHTFGWYIRKYVTDVQAKGGIPIVMSLTPRNSWKDGKVALSSGDTYGGWSEEAAKATGAIFVDHNLADAQALEALGQEEGAKLFADGKLHWTHDGAILNAKMAVSGLKAIPNNPLGKYFSSAADAIPAFKAADDAAPKP